MRLEIGSHYEYDYKRKTSGQKVDWLPKGSDFTYTFSGRAAIDLAIKDIQTSHKVKTVYMPSYCCESMVQPFIKHEINVIFYDVNYSMNKISYNVDLNTECDIFFTMSYLGIEDFKLSFAIEEFSKRGKIIIEDITHRLFCKKPHADFIHYGIASIRKWFAIPAGGYIFKNTGMLSHKPTLSSNGIVDVKVKAMQKKYMYLQGKMINKDSFLPNFIDFEQKLKELHFDYMIDAISLRIINAIDIDFIRNRRRKNAQILYEGLRKLDTIKFLIAKPNLQTNCPLFIPIMVGNGKRDELRNYLIKHNVYCPVHWPQSKGMHSNIPKEELSLICDHRYSKKEMEYIVNIILEWSNDV